MSLLSVAARNASLAMSYGATKGSSAPTSLEVALFNGDPRNGGTELTPAGGYAPATVPNNGTTWPTAPADGEIVSAAIALPSSTDAWSDTALFWLIRDATTGDWWDSMPLPGDGITVSGYGVENSLILFVNYNATEGTP